MNQLDQIAESLSPTPVLSAPPSTPRVSQDDPVGLPAPSHFAPAPPPAVVAVSTSIPPPPPAEAPTPTPVSVAASAKPTPAVPVPPARSEPIVAAVGSSPPVALASSPPASTLSLSAPCMCTRIHMTSFCFVPLDFVKYRRCMYTRMPEHLTSFLLVDFPFVTA